MVNKDASIPIGPKCLRYIIQKVYEFDRNYETSGSISAKSNCIFFQYEQIEGLFK